MAAWVKIQTQRGPCRRAGRERELGDTHMTTERGVTLHTARSTLRPWQNSDRDPFADMCADPVVMEFFPQTLSRDESNIFVDRQIAQFNDDGWGLWALDVTGEGFAGFVGLSTVTFAAPFTPATEIGWRLSQPFWNRGLATEAATAALAYAFGDLILPEVVSITATVNLRSQRVMEKIGLRRDPADDFDHPRVPEGHSLRPHVLYRQTNPTNSQELRSPSP